MNSLLASLGLSAVLTVQPALAQSIATDLFSVVLPNGWNVQKDKNGSFLALPKGTNHDRSISIDSCNSLTRSDCSKSCNEAELRENYFYFFARQPSAMYSSRAGPDNFHTFQAIGSLGEPATWVAASVLCGPKGIVYIGSTSTVSRTDAAGLLERVLASIGWQRQ